MINCFLNVPRLESGKIHIEKQYFDLSDLLSEMEAEFTVTANCYASKLSATKILRKI